MAKNRSPKKMPAVAEPKLMPVRVDLKPEVHDLLRLEAARERMSMAKFARVMLEQVLLARAEKGR